MTIENILITDNVLCLPKANKTPNGKDKKMLITAINIVSIKPPQSFVDTAFKPNPPPINQRINRKAINQEKDRYLPKLLFFLPNSFPIQAVTITKITIPNSNSLKVTFTGIKNIITGKTAIKINTGNLNSVAEFLAITPQEKPEKLEMIPTINQMRQYWSLGYLPTINNGKLTFITCHSASVVAQEIKLVMPQKIRLNNIRLSKLLQEVLKKFFLSHSMGLFSGNGGAEDLFVLIVFINS